MHLSASCHLCVFLVCVLLKSCEALKNDATETLYPHHSSALQGAPGNGSLNRARNGGRGAAGDERSERGQMGCRELRSTKYISDGRCTSITPIKELVCAGECLPAAVLPNWIGGGGRGKKFWSRRSGQDWRCVNDKTRTQRIQLQCQDGSARTYKITVVTACKCKRYSRQHNESGNKLEAMALEAMALEAMALEAMAPEEMAPEEMALASPAVATPPVVHKHKSKSKRRLGKNRFDDNWPSRAEP